MFSYRTDINHTPVLRGALIKQSVCDPFFIHFRKYRLSDYREEKSMAPASKLPYGFLEKGGYGVRAHRIHAETE